MEQAKQSADEEDDNSSQQENFIGEFDPGSGRTLAACLTHASRTEKIQHQVF